MNLREAEQKLLPPSATIVPMSLQPVIPSWGKGGKGEKGKKGEKREKRGKKGGQPELRKLIFFGGFLTFSPTHS
jgi:hypothetical protein